MKINDALEYTLPDFGNNTSVSKIGLIQVNSLILRLEGYKIFLDDVYNRLEGIAEENYSLLGFENLMFIKDSVQQLVQTREGMWLMIKQISKDITHLKKEYKILDEKYKEKYPE